MNFNCNAYFVDLDGLNPAPIIRKHESDNVMRTQMVKLQHIQDILKRTSNNNIIVGFIRSNAESIEYSCLRPEVVELPVGERVRLLILQAGNPPCP